MSKKNHYPFRIYCWMLLLCACCTGTGCHSGDKTHVDDSPIKGTISISVDESFEPVISEQIKVYESSYPEAHLIAHYKPEADCLRDLFHDPSTRMVIVTRQLDRREERFFLDSLSYVPLCNEVATDAITLVVNTKSTDTVFTLDRLQKELSGSSTNASGTMGREIFVFDGLNATSTVRYAVDSILRGQKFDTSRVKAVRSSREVLEYVALNQNAVGFVGIGWIGNPEDTAQVNMLKKVKMAYVRCDKCPDSPYVKPTQQGILSERYPLVRGLYYIVKENYTGLGIGFANFLQYERGQLVFKRAYLGPRMGFEIRNVRLKEKL